MPWAGEAYERERVTLGKPATAPFVDEFAAAIAEAEWELDARTEMVSPWRAPPTLLETRAYPYPGSDLQLPPGMDEVDPQRRTRLPPMPVPRLAELHLPHLLPLQAAPQRSAGWGIRGWSGMWRSVEAAQSQPRGPERR